MDPEQLIFNMMNGIPEWGRVDPFSIKVNGDPINFAGTYWIALSEQLHTFLLINDLIPFAEMQTGLLEYKVVRDYMSELNFLEYGIEGRIIDCSPSVQGLSCSQEGEDSLGNGPVPKRKNLNLMTGKPR